MYYYEKTLLYSYASLSELSTQIDEIVLKKALCSYYDFSPCETQAERILEISWQKKQIIDLKNRLKEIFDTFSKEDLDYFEYKYFKRKKKDYFDNFDAFSRNYFRHQIKLMEIFSKKLIDNKMTFEWFSETYMKIDFFKELMKRVKEKEENEILNNSQKKKVKKMISNINKISTVKLSHSVTRIYNNKNAIYS